MIQAGRAAGIPLEQIRATLATLPAHRTPTRRDWERLSRGWREDIDRRIATLEALRSRLTTCIGCGCLSIDACELLNPDDEAAEIGSGAHYLRRDSRVRSRQPLRRLVVVAAATRREPALGVEGHSSRVSTT